MTKYYSVGGNKYLRVITCMCTLDSSKHSICVAEMDLMSIANAMANELLDA